MRARYSTVIVTTVPDGWFSATVSAALLPYSR
jgi:hypothetical protein